MRKRAARHSPRTITTALVGLALVVATAGCGSLLGAGGPVWHAPHAIPVGSSTQSITVDGTTRTFHLYRPEGLLHAAPLVVMLHGGFGTGTEAEKYYGWDHQADQGHFLVVYPDGLHRAWDAGGGCCGIPASDHTDDVGFLSQMVAVIKHEVPIDPHRVFATGISNGGLMAYRLACDTTVFAAIGPDSATLMGPCPHPAPASVIHIHGTADHNIPYDGGPGDGPGHVDGPAVPALNATWRGIDGCAPPTVTTQGVVTTSVATCPDGRSVELITIAGAGHQWPGSPDKPLLQRVLGLDQPSTALDATPVIWQFFVAHPG